MQNFINYMAVALAGGLVICIIVPGDPTIEGVGCFVWGGWCGHQLSKKVTKE